jgi:hypothetical protein
LKQSQGSRSSKKEERPVQKPDSTVETAEEAGKKEEASKAAEKGERKLRLW